MRKCLGTLALVFSQSFPDQILSRRPHPHQDLYDRPCEALAANLYQQMLSFDFLNYTLILNICFYSVSFF